MASNIKSHVTVVPPIVKIYKFFKQKNARLLLHKTVSTTKKKQKVVTE